MNPTLLKILGGTMIFAGEALAIYQEMIAARAAKEQGLTLATGAWMLGWMTLAGALLLTGYYLGYLSFKNIWIVTVISVGGILIVEPILITLFFKELPTTGAWIGLALAVAAIIAAML